MSSMVVTISALNARGEGLAEHNGDTIAVPYTLVGEKVEIKRQTDELMPDTRGKWGVLQNILEASPKRNAPFCPHYAHCGGCHFQHWSPEAAAAWKHQHVVQTLSKAGIEAPIEPLRIAHGEGRRRAIFHARPNRNGQFHFGFSAYKSHELIHIDQCPLLHPMLQDKLPVLQQLVKPLMQFGKPMDIQATWTITGLDVDIRGIGAARTPPLKALTAWVVDNDVARLSWHGETLVENRPPLLMYNNIPIVPPCGGFLQATQLGETILMQEVAEGIGDAKKVVDLFAGMGPFTMAIAHKQSVLALDSTQAALKALERAIHQAPALGLRLKDVRVMRRDLYRQPLEAQELKKFDAVIFDPPRAGGGQQTNAIAESGIKRVVAVSCNVDSFKDDALTLIAAGYEITKLTPVDQFWQTPHVELVAVFQKKSVRQKNESKGQKQ